MHQSNFKKTVFCQASQVFISQDVLSFQLNKKRNSNFRVFYSSIAFLLSALAVFIPLQNVEFYCQYDKWGENRPNRDIS